MGTRHFQKVINKEGEVKIAQYGQWDGYPSGQGVEILRYLKSGNLSKYQEELDKIPLINDEQQTLVDKTPNWTKTYPYLSRDCGSQIHQMIEDGGVKFVSHMDDYEANQWCEGFYTIDFKENVFISVFDKEVRYPLDNLPTEEKYLHDNKSDDDEEPEEVGNAFAASFDDKINSVEGIVERLEEILVDDENAGDRLPKKAIDRISLAITKGEELIELLSDIAFAATLGEIGDEEE